MSNFRKPRWFCCGCCRVRSSAFFTKNLDYCNDVFVNDIRKIFTISRNKYTSFKYPRKEVDAWRKCYENSIVSDGRSSRSPIDRFFEHARRYHIQEEKRSRSYILTTYKDFTHRFKNNEKMNFKPGVTIGSNDSDKLCDECYYPVRLIVNFPENISTKVFDLEKIVKTTKQSKYVFVGKRKGRGSLAPNELKASYNPDDLNELHDRDKKNAKNQMVSCKFLVKAFSELLSKSFYNHEMKIRVISIPLSKFIECVTGENCFVTELRSVHDISHRNKDAVLRIAARFKGRHSKADYVLFQEDLEEIDVLFPKYGDLRESLKPKDVLFSKNALIASNSSSDHRALIIRPRLVLSSYMSDMDELKFTLRETYENCRRVSLRNGYVCSKIDSLIETSRKDNIRKLILLRNNSQSYVSSSNKIVEFDNICYIQLLFCEGADEGAAESNLSQNRHLAMVSRFTPFDHPHSQKKDYNLLFYLSLYEKSKGMKSQEFKELVGGKGLGQQLKMIEDTVQLMVLGKTDMEYITGGEEIIGKTLLCIRFRFLFRNDECHFEYINYPLLERSEVRNGEKEVVWKNFGEPLNVVSVKQKPKERKEQPRLMIDEDSLEEDLLSKKKEKLKDEDDEEDTSDEEYVDEETEGEGEGDFLGSGPESGSTSSDIVLEIVLEDVSSKVVNSGRVILDTRKNDRVNLISTTPNAMKSPDIMPYELKTMEKMLLNIEFRNFLFLDGKCPEKLFEVGNLIQTVYSGFDIFRVLYDVCVHLFKNIQKNNLRFVVYLEQLSRYSLPEKDRNRYSNVFYKCMRKFGVIDSGIFVYEEGEGVKVDRKLFHSKKESNVLKLDGNQAKKFLGVKKWKNKDFKDSLRIEIEKEFRRELFGRGENFHPYEDFRNIQWKALFPYLDLVCNNECKIWAIISKTTFVSDEECIFQLPRLLDISTNIFALISPYTMSLGRYVVYRNYPFCLLLMIIMLGQIGGGSMSGIELLMGIVGIKGFYKRTRRGRNHGSFRNISFPHLKDFKLTPNDRWYDFIYSVLTSDVLCNKFLSDLFLNIEKYSSSDTVSGFIDNFVPVDSLPEYLRNIIDEDTPFFRNDDLEKKIIDIQVSEMNEVNEGYEKMKSIITVVKEIQERYDKSRRRLSFNFPLPEDVRNSLINQKNKKTPRIQLELVEKLISRYKKEDGDIGGMDIMTSGLGKTDPEKVIAILLNHTENNIVFFFLPGIIIPQWKSKFEEFFEEFKMKKVFLVIPDKTSKMKTESFLSSVISLQRRSGFVFCTHDFPRVVENNYLQIESIDLLREMMMKDPRNVFVVDEAHLFFSQLRADLIILSFVIRRRTLTGTPIVNFGKVFLKNAEFVLKRSTRYQQELEELKLRFKLLERSAKRDDFTSMNEHASVLRELITKKLKDVIHLNLEPVEIEGIELSEYIAICPLSQKQKDLISQEKRSNILLRVGKLSKIFLTPFLEGKDRKFNFENLPSSDLEFYDSPKLEFIVKYLQSCYYLTEYCGIYSVPIVISTRVTVTRFLFNLVSKMFDEGKFEGNDLKKPEECPDTPRMNDEEEDEDEKKQENDTVDERFFVADGNLNFSDRFSTVNSFNKSKKKFKVLFFTIDSCGVGMDDIKAANKIIFCESPWTVSKYKQGVGRAWRWGQENDVEVLDPLTELEELVVFLLQTRKSLLVESIFGGRRVNVLVKLCEKLFMKMFEKNSIGYGDCSMTLKFLKLNCEKFLCVRRDDFLDFFFLKRKISVFEGLNGSSGDEERQKKKQKKSHDGGEREDREGGEDKMDFGEE